MQVQFDAALNHNRFGLQDDGSLGWRVQYRKDNEDKIIGSIEILFLSAWSKALLLQ